MKVTIEQTEFKAEDLEQGEIIIVESIDSEAVSSPGDNSTYIDRPVIVMDLEDGGKAGLYIGDKESFALINDQVRWRFRQRGENIIIGD